MPHWCCATCGVEQADSADPPVACAICSDERQYVPRGGQRWTSLEALGETGHAVHLEHVEPGLVGLTVDPQVGIGQRALLVRTPAGNLLWDPVGYVDDAAVDAVAELGGVAVIAASHPHMYGVQSAWSAAFGGAPILVDPLDRSWVQRDDPAIVSLDGDTVVLPGVELRRVGGHFPGSLVAHWTGADGLGVVLSGDAVAPNPNGTAASFLRSFPNLIPLSGPVALRVAARVAERPFDRLYGNVGGVIERDARAVVLASAERYAAWARGDHDDLT